MASPEHGVRRREMLTCTPYRELWGKRSRAKGILSQARKLATEPHGSSTNSRQRFAQKVDQPSRAWPLACSDGVIEIGRETMHELSTRLTEGGGCFTSKREEPVMPLTRCIWVFFRLKDLVYGSLGQDQSCVLSVTAAFIPSVTGARNNPSLILGLINHLAATVPTSFPWIKTELKMRKPTLTPLDHFNEIQHSNMHGEMKSMHILSKLRCRPV
ncbi:hypothetical protein H113_08061 [Trichophyton rubrum MR1459]|nr:hypothetical protein H113_08061 [Trichophyton rubrum MR1459]EZG12458.1 hypothetical protein H107_08138 [Trichophyton rubrum CBS 202.88]